MKKLLFSGHGCNVFEEDTSIYVYFDSGESRASVLLKLKIDEALLDKIKKSENDAYDVIMSLEKEWIKVID